MRRSSWGADVRYAGQGYDLSVPVGRSVAPERLVADLRDAFHATHLKAYGHAAEADEIELVNVRVTGRLPRAGSLSRAITRRRAPGRDPDRCGWARGSAGWRARSSRRADLRAPAVGPVLVEEFDTTTVVPPGWTARLDGQSSIVMEHVA